MELRDPGQFERKIYAKSFDAVRFREELRALPVGETVALGTATDPYQPAERRYGVTRKMLEVFAQVAGLRLGITTKSDLIVRDVGLLKEVSRRHYLTVSVTVTTVDRRARPAAGADGSAARSSSCRGAQYWRTRGSRSWSGARR